MENSDQEPVGARHPVKVSYTHDAMIDAMLSNPSISGGELARNFGYTESWISTIRNSDAFQARYAERRKDLVDPVIIASIDERLRAVADKSLERVLDKLTSVIPPSDDFLLQSAKLATGALGYGARPTGGNSTQTNVAVVIQVPPKITSSADWAAAHAIPTAQRMA